MSIGFIRKNNYLFVYLLLILLINIFLQTLPLTNVFGYEFSALNSILLSFLSGLYTISILDSAAKEELRFNFSLLRNALIWMLFIPFIISIVRSIIFGFCSFWDGLWFYIFISVPSVIIGSAFGTFIYFIFTKFKKYFFVILFILILFIPVLEIYFNPQVYLFNPLFAYFPGTIYDEGLTVDFKLITYRIFNLLFFIPILVYSGTHREKNISVGKKISFALILLLMIGIFYFLISPSLGFTTTESSLRKKLSKRVESEHFIIHSDIRINKDELKFITLSQEYYYSVLRKYFKETPRTKIITYLFFNSEQKKNLIGSGSADVAKPWLNNIYISMDSWESTLKHEIAHCFTVGFGTGIFKLASGFNPSLIEGMAEAADGFYDENSIHYLASTAYKNQYRVDMNSMFNSFDFFGSVSSLSYIYSGSFLKYLADNYGIQKVKSFYGDGNFERNFHSDIFSVIKKYEAFIDTFATDDTKNIANYYFGRKALISKICPRYISSSLAEAWKEYQSNNLKESEYIFNNVLAKSESYSAIIGLSTIYKEQDSVIKAINIMDNYISIFSGTSYEYDLKLRLADMLVLNNQFEEANKIYKYLADSKPNKRIDLISNVRISLLKKNQLRKYIEGSEHDKYEILKELNNVNYNYACIPLMIDLSNSLHENYELFLNIFRDNFEVKDEISSYALYKLSQYMMENQDYIRARKMAGFSVRFTNDTNLLLVTQQNFNKTDWFVRNAEFVFQNTKFDSN